MMGSEMGECIVAQCHNLAEHSLDGVKLRLEHALRIVAYGKAQYSPWLTLKDGREMRATPHDKEMR